MWSEHRLCSVIVITVATAACGGGKDTRDGGLPSESGLSCPAGDTCVGRYQVQELTFSHPSASLANPWENVQLAVTFSAPSGRMFTVGGFYYDTDTWKARVAPDELGHWSWSAALTDPSSGTTSSSGAFEVMDAGEHGFVRVNPNHPMRLVFSDGTPYTPLGINECLPQRTTPTCWDGPPINGVAFPFNELGFDGDFRWPSGCTTMPITACDGTTFTCPRADCPAGDAACCAPGDARCQAGGWHTDIETFLAAYQQAGFNLFRYGSGNCAFSLYQNVYPTGNRYDVTTNQWADELFQRLRAHGFRIFITLWWNRPFPSPTPAQQQAEIRAANYVVDRYGAYVDIFEIFNENQPDASYETWMPAAIRARDPYGHLVTMSYPDPANPSSIDITSPHWYADPNPLNTDTATASFVAGWPTNKPIIAGEAGNANDGNWSAVSGIRLRIKTWTALFRQATLVYWNATYAKDNGSVPANQYIGPTERTYTAVWSTFARALDADTRMVSISASSNLRAYGLASSAHAWAYVVNGVDQTNPTTGATLTIASPIAGTASFVSPIDGSALGTAPVVAGSNTLMLPPFIADLAVKIEP